MKEIVKKGAYMVSLEEPAPGVALNDLLGVESALRVGPPRTTTVLWSGEFPRRRLRSGPAGVASTSSSRVLEGEAARTTRLGVLTDFGKGGGFSRMKECQVNTRVGLGSSISGTLDMRGAVKVLGRGGRSWWGKKKELAS